MKRTLITVTLLVIIVSTFYILLKQPNDMVKLPTIEIQKNVNAVNTAKNISEQPDTEHITAVTPQPKILPIDNKEVSQITDSIISDNPAAQLDQLPKDMQQEIKRLSGRYHKNIQPIEIEPGVFLIPAGKGVSVVPVAVMNEDGTVSIHEY